MGSHFAIMEYIPQRGRGGIESFGSLTEALYVSRGSTVKA